jgi:hypothetical protein
MQLKQFMAIGLTAAVAANAALVEVRDDDIQAGQSRVWTTGNTYLLKEKVFVESGAVLTIQPGVVVKGESMTGAQAAALIICRGAKIIANGTREQPIIFTAKADDLLPYDETILDVTNTTGLWGGVVILGNARTNWAAGYGAVEGVDLSDTRGQYGGADDNDSSGVFRYVSIRFAGMEVRPDVELNGLTLGGVGRRTKIEYVEVFNNADDAFEWFGGCVNTRYLLAVNCMDDGFDYDVGFRGRGQYWCCLHGNAGPDSRCGEHDGGDSPQDAEPYSIPSIANVTYLAKNDRTTTIMFRENAGGKYVNSIFHDCGDIFIDEELCEARYRAGDILLHRNVLWAGSAPTGWSFWDPYSGIVTTALQAGGNAIGNPRLNCSLPRNLISSPRGTLDMRPRDTLATSSLAMVNDIDGTGFLEQACFKGAFDPTQPMWTRGWTALDFYGYLSSDDAPTMASLPDCQSTGVRHAAATAAPTKAVVTRITRLTGGDLLLAFSQPPTHTATVELYALNGWRLATAQVRNGAASVRMPCAAAPIGPVLWRMKTAEGIHSGFETVTD